MNGKASVTKELNAKHIKILEGLLKLPENRECADCKTKAPRWASVNIGVFICLHCSGIHRSLGVHISKVRSVTLDTWLPQQVAFLQSMGNEKSNAHWEAELPTNYNRGGIENFIRAKYVEKRWVPRYDSKIKAPPRSKEELASPSSSRPGTGDSFGGCANNQLLYKEKKDLSTSEKEGANVSGEGNDKGHEDRAGDRQPHQHQEIKEKHQPSVDLSASDVKNVLHESPTKANQVAPSPTPCDSPQKSVVSKVKSSASNATPVVPSPKVDYATELFRMLCMDDAAEKDSSSSSDANAWVDFESDEEVSRKEVKMEPKSVRSKVHPEPKMKDAQKAPVTSTKGCSHEHQRDFKNDKPSPSVKDNILSGGSLHLQGLPMLAQDGSFLAVATGKPNGRSLTYPSSTYHQGVNMFQQPSLNGGSVNCTVGTQMPVQNGGPAKFGVNPARYANPSSYRPATALNGISTIPAKRAPAPAALPVSGNDYDFSFLTQGMFSKR